MRLPSICVVSGCPAIALVRGRCANHAESYQRNRSQAYDQGRGTPAERGYGSRWLRERIRYLRANPFCVECGDLATVVDHVIPKRQGGPDDVTNYQAMCESCHNRKRQRESRG